MAAVRQLTLGINAEVRWEAIRATHGSIAYALKVLQRWAMTEFAMRLTVR